MTCIKITTILKKCRKKYYTKLLENKKQSCKETWNILNAIINKIQKDSSYPDCFEMNGRNLQIRMTSQMGLISSLQILEKN